MPVPHNDFLRLLAGEVKDKEKDKNKPKTKLLLVIVWWSFYAWVTKARGKEVLYTLRLNDDDSIKDTPLSVDEWIKVVKAVVPQLRVYSLDAIISKDSPAVP